MHMPRPCEVDAQKQKQPLVNRLRTIIHDRHRMLADRAWLFRGQPWTIARFARPGRRGWCSDAGIWRRETGIHSPSSQSLCTVTPAAD